MGYLIKGKQFGRWTVIARVPGGKAFCICSCGTLRNVTTSKLYSRTSNSCGCVTIQKLEKTKAIRKIRKKAQIAKAVKKWQSKNKPKLNALASKYLSKKSNAVPPWLNVTHFREIEAVFVLAKKIELKTGIKHHVDHIIPLHGKNVCGLHVPWNLQVLSAEENIKKGNKIVDSITAFSDLKKAS